MQSVSWRRPNLFRADGLNARAAQDVSRGPSSVCSVAFARADALMRGAHSVALTSYCPMRKDVNLVANHAIRRAPAGRAFKICVAGERYPMKNRSGSAAASPPAVRQRLAATRGAFI